MTIYTVLGLDQQPVLHLALWRVMEITNVDGSLDRHFIGFNLESHDGRVSSKITEYDVLAMTGKTHSGRIYELYGEPGDHDDA
jgi:hypothetical protein